MIKYVLLFSLFAFSSLQAQSDTSDPLQEPTMEQSMDEAFGEISKFLDTMDMKNIMGMGLDSMMMQAFSFDGENMQGLGGALDSIGLSEMFGGQGIGQLFEGMDMKELDQMMEQSMQMLQGIDMTEMQKMMESIDMSELMKMFEGMDIQGFENIMPPAGPNEAPTQKKEKLKKI